MSFSEDTNKKLMFICYLTGRDVEEYIEEIVNTHLDNISLEEINKEVKKLFKPNKIQNNYSQGDNIYEIPVSSQALYGNIELRRDEFYSTSSNTKLKFNIHDMLYLRECLNNGLTINQHKGLLKEVNTSHGQLNKTLYNLQNNPQLNMFIDEFLSKMDNCIFEMKGTLVISGEETHMETIDVQSIIHQYHNAPYKEYGIWAIIKNSQFDPLHIRIVCENANNEFFTELMSSEKKQIVVNNREKRQNLIMNGGI